MKKLIPAEQWPTFVFLCFLLCAFAVLLLEGDNAAPQDPVLSEVYRNGFVAVYMDTRTGVQYLSGYNIGTCVMLNADGKPLVSGGLSP